MKIGILVPHIYAQESVAQNTIFAPITLVKSLCNGLTDLGHEVVLFSPGPLKVSCKNITIDMTLANQVVSEEGCTLMELVNSSPLAFVSLARQISAEITAKAFEYANTGKLDLLHVFMCEDEIPLYFSNLLKISVVFTNHDPYNFYRKYRARFPNLKNLNYVSISLAQRKTAPKALNFVANVYNGINLDDFPFNETSDNHFAYVGRIIRNKGPHIAIEACKSLNEKLILAGKHYSNEADPDSYWAKYIKPELDGKLIKHVGFLKYPNETAKFMGKAKALLFPIEWEEPFGLVAIESMATGTPVIAFDRGPMRELIKEGVTGFIVKNLNEMKEAMLKVNRINRKACRDHIIKHFSVESMINGYEKLFTQILDS